MDDLISRRAAINELKRITFLHLFEYGEYLSEDTRVIEIISSSKALEAISALPSVQPERAEGEWIPFDVEYECSHCGIILQFNDGTPKDNNANFCPNCGADMRGGEND